MSQTVTVSEDKPSNNGFLKKLEIFGNKLPNPAILFLMLIALLAVISAVLASAHVSALHPTTHKAIYVKSLISKEGLHWILTEMIRNYLNFPPLGMIVVLTLGIRRHVAHEADKHYGERNILFRDSVNG
jgi:aminobenzoyl-glutamate transport protein